MKFSIKYETSKHFTKALGDICDYARDICVAEAFMENFVPDVHPNLVELDLGIVGYVAGGAAGLQHDVCLSLIHI